MLSISKSLAEMYGVLVFKLSSCQLCSGLKVEAERTYHQRILQILDQLEGEVSSHATTTHILTFLSYSKVQLFIFASIDDFM